MERMTTKHKLYKCTAEADQEPENYYSFACENGTAEMIWIYNNHKDALLALPDFESSCKLFEKGRYFNSFF